MTIKVVNGYSGGCNSRSVYCDGEIHVIVEWVACHHVLDYDDPDDIEYRVQVRACDPKDHHDPETCYDCNVRDEDYSDCRFAPWRIEEDRNDPWEYSWTEYHEDLIKTFKEKGDSPYEQTVSVTEEIPWSSNVNPHVNARRVNP